MATPSAVSSSDLQTKDPALDDPGLADRAVEQDNGAEDDIDPELDFFENINAHIQDHNPDQVC